MKPKILLALAALWHLTSHAADVLPAYLTGTWGTAESLYTGTTKQSEMHLQADGLGLMIGSTAPARRADGVDDGKPGPRALIGVPIHATLEGEALIARPFALRSEDRPAQGAYPSISCRYEAAGPSLTCAEPDGTPTIMKRRSETVSAESAKMLDAIRSKSY